MGASGWLAVVFTYTAVAVLLTWPLAAHLRTRLGAPVGEGDPYLNLWILGWVLGTWVDNPGAVLSGAVFDANTFHPARRSLTFSDHFLLQALVLSPVYALTRDATLCYNLLLLASLVANGVAMYALVRALTGSTVPAVAAGLAWMVWPYRTAHLLHLQLQATYFLPVVLLALHRLTAGRQWRDAVALGGLTAAQAMASVYYGVMTGPLLVVTSVVLAVSTGQTRSRRLAVRLAGAAAVAFAAIVPIVLVYAQSQREQGFARSLVEASRHSATVRSYLQAPDENWVYGQRQRTTPASSGSSVAGEAGVEQRLFPGATVMVLATIGLVTGLRSDKRAAALSAASLAGLGAVLSLGPAGGPVYAWAYDWLPGFEAIRAPARFAVLAMLGLVLLAGLAMHALERRMGADSRPVWLWLLPLLMLAEGANAPLALAAAPPRDTAVGQWLKAASEPGAVAHLPMSGDVGNTSPMVQSLEHRRPLVNGYSGQRPASFSAIVEHLSRWPDAEALAQLRELDVRFVVSAPVEESASGAASPLVERARFGNTAVYELRWTPDALTALDAFTALPPVPAPGPLPFVSGERLRYAVRWESGPVNLQAGDAELLARRASAAEVAGTGSEAAWVFEAAVTSAPWVARFFDARDRFRTMADARLQPLLHTREIREGRRRLDRAYLFDRDAGVIRVGQTPEGARQDELMRVPMRSKVLDALSALFLLRTLPVETWPLGARPPEIWPPGARPLVLPLSDAGKTLLLRVHAEGREAISVAGQPRMAIRLRPELVERAARRQAVQLLAWVSDDQHREPLAVVVTASFGRVRLDLVESRR